MTRIDSKIYQNKILDTGQYLQYYESGVQENQEPTLMDEHVSLTTLYLAEEKNFLRPVEIQLITWKV